VSSAPETLSPGFGALPEAKREYDRAATVVLPLPYDATTTYRGGARRGPDAILCASENLELFDERLLFEPADAGIATLVPVEPDARGPQQTIERITTVCEKPVADGKFLVSLGGEHTVSLGCLKATLDKYPDTSLLIVDAHADLRDEYQNSPFSHACVARRALEICPVEQVGVRSFSRAEHEFMKSNGIRPFVMDVIRSRPEWASEVVERLGPQVYLSIDLDGLDPSLCPGVGTPEPGGLTWQELLLLIEKLFESREVVAADIVECSPLAGQNVTEFLAAKLAYKIMAHRLATRT